MYLKYILSLAPCFIYLGQKGQRILQGPGAKMLYHFDQILHFSAVVVFCILSSVASMTSMTSEPSQHNLVDLATTILLAKIKKRNFNPVSFFWHNAIIAD